MPIEEIDNFDQFLTDLKSDEATGMDRIECPGGGFAFMPRTIQNLDEWQAKSDELHEKAAASHAADRAERGEEVETRDEEEPTIYGRFSAKPI